MEVSRKSLWFWLWNTWYCRHFYRRPPNDLCSFVRQVLWASICLPIRWAAMGAIGALVALALGVVVGTMLSPFWYYYISSSVDYVVVAIGTGMWIVLSTIVLFVIMQSQIKAWLRQRRYGSYNKPPSIVGAYVRARKEKYCPMISFTN